MFIFKTIFLKDFLESLVLFAVVLFGGCTKANTVHHVTALVGAGCFDGVHAVVLIVHEISNCADLAAESIEPVDSDVDNSFAVLYPVVADEVPSFSSIILIHIAISCEFAISVLNIYTFYIVRL